MKNRRILTVVAFIMSAVMLVLAFSSCRKKELTPSEKIENALQNTFENTLDGDLAKLLLSSSENGSVTVDFKFPDELGAPFDSYSVKTYMGKKHAVSTLSFVMGGETLDATLYAKENNIALSSSAILGESVYGLDLENAKANYLKSIFVDPESPYNLISLLGENGETFDTIDKLSAVFEDVVKIIDSYTELASDLLDKYSVCTENTADGITTITMELNNEGVKNIIRELFNKAKADKELRSTASTVVDLVEELEGMFGGAVLPDTDFGVSGLSAEAEENVLMKEYDEFFKDETALNELFEELDEITFSVKTQTAIKDKKVSSIAISLDATHKELQETVTASVTLDLSSENKAVLTLKIAGPNEEEQEIKVIFETTEDTDSSYKGSVSVAYGAATIRVLDVVVDKANGTFELSSEVLASTVNTMGNSKFAVKGTYKLNSSEFSASITEIAVGEESVKFEFKYTVLANDKAPEYPSDVKDLFSLTEADIEALAQDVMEKIQNLGGVLGEEAF